MHGLVLAVLLASAALSPPQSQGPEAQGTDANARPAAAQPADANRADTDPDGAPAAPVPEPGTLLLVGTGLVGLALTRRRRRSQGA